MTDAAETNWYSDETATFGDRIAAAREAQSLTQKSLARKIGIATKTLEAWENDLSEPRANRLPMLSGVLNVPMRWLLTGEGEGVEDVHLPDGDAGVDVSDILSEMRTLRTQMAQAADRIGVLEKRLRVALADEAA